MTFYPWRVGRKVGRTIYEQRDDNEDGVLIGFMDTIELAEMVVRDHNRTEQLEGERAALLSAAQAVVNAATGSSLDSHHPAFVLDAVMERITVLQRVIKVLDE